MKNKIRVMLVLSIFLGNASYFQNAVASDPYSTPQLETQFIEAVKSAQAKYKEAANDMARGGIRAERKNNVCLVLNSGSVENWVGKIKELSSNSDGKGVLSITIAKDISVATWNNALSDISDKTLIDPSSELFSTASKMKEGDDVVFSGKFIHSDLDCASEQSLTLEGSIEEPAYTLNFTNLVPLKDFSVPKN